MKEEKKKSNALFYIGVIVVLAGIALYIIYFKTDIFTPKVDMSGSEYTGTWKAVGNLLDDEYIVLLEEDFVNPEECETALELYDDGTSCEIVHMANMMSDGSLKLIPKDEAEALDKTLSTWSESEDGITLTYKGGAGTTQFKKAESFLVNTTGEPITPADLGYDSEYFIYGIYDGQGGGYAYAK